MRRRWQLVAERADKRSYTLAEIADALVPALEQGERLTPRAFEDGAEPSFRAKGRITGALREYAIAGALHLDHLAALADGAVHDRALGVAAFHIGGALGLPPAARGRLDRLSTQHSNEWEAFMLSLGQNSFVADWAMRGRT